MRMRDREKETGLVDLIRNKPASVRSSADGCERQCEHSMLAQQRRRILLARAACDRVGASPRVSMAMMSLVFRAGCGEDAIRSPVRSPPPTMISEPLSGRDGGNQDGPLIQIMLAAVSYSSSCESNSASLSLL